MGALVPVKSPSELPEPNTGKLAIRDLPLGTAEWFHHDRHGKPVFRMGDFWVARMPSGEAFGLRDDRHGLIASGTRSGKGVSVIIPNLVLWPGSIFVIDPKGENAKVTARRRGGGSRYCWGIGQTVRILDPFNEVQNAEDDFADMKVRFNPLSLLHLNNDHSVDDAGRIADSIVVSEGSNDPFWEDSARTVIKTLCLHVATAKHFSKEERTLVKMRELLVEGDMRLRELVAKKLEGEEPPSALGLLFTSMSRNSAFGGVIAQTGEMLLDLVRSSPRLLGSILQVARTNTEFIASPPMRRCLEASDFELSELKSDPNGTSLYLCLPQRYMPDHFRWLRMMTTLTIGEMERLSAQPASGHPVLMMLDEFPALKRMRSVENAAAQISGFGVKMIFVVQTLAQLKDIYKDNWETFVANAGIKLFFGNDDHFTRDYVSKLIGDCEIIREVKSMSHADGRSSTHTTGSSATTGYSFTSGYSSSSGVSGGSASMSGGFSTSSTTNSSFTTSSSFANGKSRTDTNGVSETVHKRPLVTPDEVGRLFGDPDNPAMLVFVSGKQPMFLKRLPYFRDEDFVGCYDQHPDHPAPATLIDVTFQRLSEHAETELEAKKTREFLEEMAAKLKAEEEA